jgi:hypothetical protein
MVHLIVWFRRIANSFICLHLTSHRTHIYGKVSLYDGYTQRVWYRCFCGKTKTGTCENLHSWGGLWVNGGIGEIQDLNRLGLVNWSLQQGHRLRCAIRLCLFGKHVWGKPQDQMEPVLAGEWDMIRWFVRCRHCRKKRPAVIGELQKHIQEWKDKPPRRIYD